MNKVIGIFAHVDAGKTTLAETILYHTNIIKSRGRIESKNTYLDTHKIEKERGITIFSEQAYFEYNNNKYFLIDTPGHIDFSQEMERNIEILDYAIIVISALEGIQGHTETVWKLLYEHNIPIFFFINKIDRNGINISNILNEIKENLTKDIVLIKKSINKELDLETAENIADIDYELLDYYLENGYNKNLWIKHIQILMKDMLLFPVFMGSALLNKGIKEFLESIDILTTTKYIENEDLKARVFKIRYDKNGNRVSFIKIYSGKIKLKQEIEIFDKNNFNKKIIEKIDEIRIYNGKNYTNAKEAKAGEIVGIVGIANSFIGMGIGIEHKKEYNIKPTLKSKVIFNNNDSYEIIKIFKILAEEDTTLEINWNENLKELNLSVMGIIQLEVLKDIIKDRFNIDISFEKPGILYKETINNTVVGKGHFEPLRHYAEVHLRLEPLPRGSGIQFKNLCISDNFPIGYQNLVKQHIFEREHRGILTASPITDIKITLIKGRSHEKHTEGGDFREATYRALRQGLEKADNILLEPFYEFKIKTDIDFIGKIITDIQKLNGSFEVPEISNKKVIINGKAPVSSFMGYSKELINITGGKASIDLRFYGYDKCINQKEIIKKISYNKDSDLEYTSSSVFCSKGKGYIVPWYEADEKMHCK
ncbi:small GTP-binding protein [Hypnocyclicus thermotrophus]|uniref:Small GTP-binding protein n=1 Tax=Hypnocyclicus thermotrophus TaxID=1627895 RepID=A0AA46DZ09_9FUSO|nr:TetM/TetW/TetO/TetS family tetracycline resistance ribosomal protection protein [Hypnocyclicus thermotrophus]TDT70525.1 small GTP-binding protein [Hypnocyclicus thermotrophus]